MLTPMSRLVLVFCLSFLSPPLYAQNTVITINPAAKESVKQAALPSPKDKKQDSFLVSVNKKISLPPEKDKNNRIKINKEDRNFLREEWRRALGVDIFYPYFKAKEIEDWLKEKVSIRLFNIKGRPQLSDDQVKYIFKISF